MHYHLDSLDHNVCERETFWNTYRDNAYRILETIDPEILKRGITYSGKMEVKIFSQERLYN
jgi:hypothetical protein